MNDLDKIGCERPTDESNAHPKKKIAIFFGGCSTEYEVSLQSAYAIITHIDQRCYDLVLVGIERHTGQWFLFRGNEKDILQDTWHLCKSCAPVFCTTNKKVHGLHYWEKGLLLSLPLDAALPILHGKNGEDGTVQGALELAGIPVIGCNLLSSALCMDKELAHRVVAAQGIRVARSAIVHKPYDMAAVLAAAASLQYPLFVKPIRAGSSFGIAKVMAEAELIGAIEAAFEHDDRVVMEENVPGFEVGCAVLGTDQLLVGEVDEIELTDGFFNFTEKYTLQTSHIHVPARIAPQKADEIKQAAQTIYRALGCSGFARVDLFLTPAGELYFNEVNTIPGFTAHSRYPTMLKAAGLSFEEIVGRLLRLGVQQCSS